MTACHLIEAKIAARLREQEAKTGWQSADLLIDTVAELEGIDREHVRSVWVRMTTMQGAG